MMSIWPLLPRRDIVGRRCVTVNCNHDDVNGEPLNMGRGVIRASSHADPSVQDEKVLVEFDNSSDWTGPQWVNIHSEFDVFLVEDALVGVVSDTATPGTNHPVLTFKAIVENAKYSINSNNFRLVEHLTPDRTLDFVNESNIVHLKEDDVRRMCDRADTSDWVCARNWLSFQQSQQVLLSWPSRAINSRVRVYNIATNSQWYSGRIIAANENAKLVTILDDSGMEHVENAALVQMELDNRDFNMTSKGSGNVSKPRGRTSTEEHPMIKQPKLDASGSAVDFSLNSPTCSQGPARQLMATTDATSEEYSSSSSITRSLQLDPGSRNVFSDLMTPQPNQGASQPGGTPVVFAITRSPLPVSKSSPSGMSASAASVLAASRSPPPNPDSSKIKTLLGYRPSVMFVIPTTVAPTQGSSPTYAETRGTPGNQQGSGEGAGRAGLTQQRSVYRLPPGVEYIGTIPLQIRSPPKNCGIFTPSTATEVGVTPTHVQGQRASNDLSNSGKKLQTGDVHRFQTSEGIGSDVQGPERPRAVVGMPSRNASGLQQVRSPTGVPRANFVQQMQGPGRVPEAQSVSGLQNSCRIAGVPPMSGPHQTQNSIKMQVVQRATGVQQIQIPDRMQGLSNPGELQSPGRYPGVQTTSGLRMQSLIRLPGVQSLTGEQQMPSLNRMQEVQSATGVQHMQNPDRISGVQSVTGAQEMPSLNRMQGVQSATGVQHVQNPDRMFGLQSAIGVQHMPILNRMQGVQSATGVQHVQNSDRMPGVQSTAVVQHMPSLNRMQGVHSATGVQRMQNPDRMSGVQSAAVAQELQIQNSMPGVQVASEQRSPGRIQTSSGVQQMQNQVRTPGMQSVGVNQQHPVRMQSGASNQLSTVRSQGMQGADGIRQISPPSQFQGVQGATAGNQLQGILGTRGVRPAPRNLQGHVRSSANGTQEIARLLNPSTGPRGQATAIRMPMQSRFQLVEDQDQNSLLRSDSPSQPRRRQSLPGVQQVQSSAHAGRSPAAPVMRGMQRPANFQGHQTLASSPQNQTGALRPNDASGKLQRLAGVKSPASSEDIVHQIVEGALRKYGLEMNCRISPATMQRSGAAASSTKSLLSSLVSPIESSDSAAQGGDSQAAAHNGGGALGRQNSYHHISAIEPFTSNFQEVSNANATDSNSSLKSTATCDVEYLNTNSSSSAGGLGSSVPGQGTQSRLGTLEPGPGNQTHLGSSPPEQGNQARLGSSVPEQGNQARLGSSVPGQGNQARRVRQTAKVSKSHDLFYDAKSDSRMVSIEILKSKRKTLQRGNTKTVDTKRRTTPKQPSSNSSSSDLLPLSKLEAAPAPGLDAISIACKLESMSTATKSAFSTSARPRASLPVIARAGDGMTRMWFEEYEDELQDLSRILDMLKRLDSAKCHQILDSTGSKMPDPKLLVNQMSSLALPKAGHQSENGRGVVTTSQKKSDCEPKVKVLLTQLRALGLKFENPSHALSKRKLNSTAGNTSNGVRTCLIQDKSCVSIPSLMLKCRECKSVSNNPDKLSQVLCRFHAFRRLTMTGKGVYVSSGFSIPTDADAVEISLWMPLRPIIEPQIDVEMAKYIIKNVGNRFCELVEQEKEAMSWIASNGDVAWKRAVNGVREMCDVCNTTLFNVHWVCRKCGYVVCLDCYRTKTHRCTRCHEDVTCATCDRGFLKWSKCSINRQPHDPKEMMLTQIIPSDVLWVVGRMIHDVRKIWRISENCPCGEDRILELSEEPSTLDQVNRVTQSDDKVPLTDSKHCERIGSGCTEPPPGLEEDLKEKLKDEPGQKTGSEGELQLADKPAFKSNSKTAKGRSPATLREFLLEKNSGFNGIKLENSPVSSCKNLDDVFRRVVKGRQSAVAASKVSPHLSPDSSLVAGDVTSTPAGPISSSPPEVKHVLLDNGRLLQLLEPRNPNNIKMFQEVWRKGQPVMFSNCDQYITKELWLPKAFAEEFGDMENDLVDCSHKVVLIGHEMRHFWQGFESVKARLKDSDGNPMILKLKDWPPTEDFSEMLPTRFKDLLQGLPLPEYTDRSGVFNLASRLPDFFVRPDLGPKMYNAYGSALHPLVGSTNLHLDVSDAVNLILYVGIPTDDSEDHEAAAIDAMKKAGCCDLTMARTTEHGHKPGALWHIFDAKDSDKIRDLLTKVGLEIGEPVEAHHDPIHDQSWYLDETLRERLLREYSVQGYTLVQCAGDAIFIPAGAPHQVRNLHSCIKAAEDFVSPENLSHCFKMTQEFRHLSDTHSNHEDKLQVKNIIYHAVKDAIAVLQNSAPPDSA